MIRRLIGIGVMSWLSINSAIATPHALVLQTDFGTKDGAVAAMRGVAFGIDSTLPIFDLSHENTPYNIWEASYRLNQAASFWPSGTVFVSVVDPGVGTERKSIVLKTKSGHYFVGPDNGSWTLVAETLGVDGVRVIDETKHRRPGSEKSHTFHGRDVFVVTGAKLAAGGISFAEVGPELTGEMVRVPYERARLEDRTLIGNIPYLDFQYGNVWTNIDEATFQQLRPKLGDQFQVQVAEEGREIFSGEVPYTRTFGEVPTGAPLLYLNSLMNVALALNQGNFAQTHHIGYGGGWTIRIKKAGS